MRFKLNNGSFGTAQSTKLKDRKRAEEWAESHIQLSTSELFSEYAADLFIEGGKYYQERIITGKRISKRDLLCKLQRTHKKIIPYFRDKKLREITRADAIQFRNSLISHYSNQTINHYLQTLKIILDFAEREGLIDHVPKIDRVANTWQKKVVLSTDEIKRLFSVKWQDEGVKLLCMLSACTGMRLGECLVLKREDIQNDHIVVSKSWDSYYRRVKPETKTGKTRVVPIPESLRLQLMRIETEWLFQRDDKSLPFSDVYISKVLKDALIRSGCSYWVTFHSFRHYFSSLLVNSGINETKVRGVIGHSEEMTRRYYHQGEDWGDIRKIQATIVP